MLRRTERIMEWWLRSTPPWMQPKAFWSAYFHILDRYVREAR